MLCILDGIVHLKNVVPNLYVFFHVWIANEDNIVSSFLSKQFELPFTIFDELYM